MNECYHDAKSEYPKFFNTVRQLVDLWDSARIYGVGYLSSRCRKTSAASTETEVSRLLLHNPAEVLRRLLQNAEVLRRLLHHMFNGLYSGATALHALNRQQEAIASNLAHLNTPGHRRMIFSFHERMEQMQPSEARPGMRVMEQAADFTQGRHQPTGRPLDLAIGGDAFFSYQGAEGTMYSRSGVVFRNPENNELVNGDGFPLLDDGGQPVTYEGPLSELSIGSDGLIARRDQTFGKIGVFQFDDNRGLESENQTYFRAGSAEVSPAEQFTVHQGTRELSNAHPVSELISLMVGSRHFEASQRAIRMMSEAMQENTRS
jgi:flagellar basal-body rod protein FlgF